MLESILKRKREAKGNGNLALEDGGVAQLGEHLPCTQGVRSSILLISTSSEPLRALLPIKSLHNVRERTTAGLEIVQEKSNGNVEFKEKGSRTNVNRKPYAKRN